MISRENVHRKIGELEDELNDLRKSSDQKKSTDKEKEEEIMQRISNLKYLVSE